MLAQQKAQQMAGDSVVVRNKDPLIIKCNIFK
jgi:hypothetical protein